jgi:hypothetical protein
MGEGLARGEAGGRLGGWSVVGDVRTAGGVVGVAAAELGRGVVGAAASSEGRDD